MATVVKSFAIQGIDGYLVDIEVKMLEGQPMISPTLGSDPMKYL